MPLYHFHSSNGSTFNDIDGTEHRSVEAARQQAVLLMASLVHDDPAAVISAGQLQVKVTDDAGAVVFELNVIASKC